MRGAGPALLPLAATILAIGVAFATGFDQRTPLPPVLEARFYGFFLDRYPIFTVAIVYGLACLVVRMARPGPAGWPRRLIGGALALGLFLAACLYPTFGGVSLRLAFASGGSAFLAQQPMLGAYALGSGLAALLYAATLGFGAALIGNVARARRRWFRRLGLMLVRTLALWFALAVLGLAPLAGFGIWPRRAMTTADALLAVALACVAFLPHLLCNGLTERGRGPARRTPSPAQGTQSPARVQAPA